MDDKDIKNLGKILKHAKDVVKETENINNSEDFKNNNDKSKAALFDLLQIGELTKDCLSSEVYKEIDNVPWKDIYNLRNRIVHGYSAVDYMIIWETIKNDIPKLINEIEKVL